MTDLAGKIAAGLCAAGTLAVALGLALPWERRDDEAGFFFIGIHLFDVWVSLWVISTALGFCALLGVIAFGRLVMGEGRRAAAGAAVAGGVALLVLCVVLSEFAYYAGGRQYLASTGLVALIAAGVIGSTQRAFAVVLLGAVVLFGSLFLPWFPSAGEAAYFNRSVGAPAASFVFADGAASAWVVFTVLDLILVVVAAIAVGAVWSALRGRRDWRSVAAGSAAATLVATVLVLWRIVDPPLDGVRAAPAVALALSGLACIGGGALLMRRYSGPMT